MRNVRLILFLLLLLVIFASCRSESKSESSYSNISSADISESSSFSKPSLSQESSTPPEDSDISTPTEESEQTKINEYTTIQTTGSAATAKIFSDEQIEEFSQRKANGEIFSLTLEEMQFIISDTIALFEKYDYVCIIDKNGDLHTFSGLPFYSSDAYYSCFNKQIDTNDPETTFDLDSDICDVIYMRMAVLDSTVCDEVKVSGMRTGASAVFSDIKNRMSESDIEKLAQNTYLAYHANSTNLLASLQTYQGAACIFFEDQIHLIENLSQGNENDYKKIFPTPFFEGNSGKYEYGNQTLTVIAEVYEEKSEKIIARIREDETKAVEEICSLWQELYTKPGGNSPENTFKTSDYRIIVYLNGLGKSFYYKYNEICDEWSLMNYENFASDIFTLTGSKQIAAKINQLVTEAVGDIFEATER